MKNLTEDELSELCVKWQNLLRLSHWAIGIRICRRNEMPLQEAQATNHISLTTEQALISILDSKDYPESIFSQDMEVSLVHELLHIPLKYFTDPEQSSLEYIHMEAFIEGMARLLVSMSRKEGTQ